MEESLRTRVSTQVYSVAEALAETGQVPHAAIMAAVVVAGRATEVGITRKPNVIRIVEEALSEQNLRPKLFRTTRGAGGDERRLRNAPINQLTDIVNPDTAVHEVVDIQCPAVR